MPVYEAALAPSMIMRWSDGFRSGQMPWLGSCFVRTGGNAMNVTMRVGVLAALSGSPLTPASNAQEAHVHALGRIEAGTDK
jgi:hypothetical protein